MELNSGLFTLGLDQGDLGMWVLGSVMVLLVIMVVMLLQGRRP